MAEEEKECNTQAEEATAIKLDCEEQLKEALPALAHGHELRCAVLKKSGAGRVEGDEGAHLPA